MGARAKVPNCKGAEKVEGIGASGLFFSRDIPGSAICGACYEDIVRATYFAGNFQRNPGPVYTAWSCDLAIPFLKRAIEDTSKSGSWQYFAKVCSIRKKIATCPGLEAVPAQARIWYQPRVPIPGFVMCGACYYDQAAMTKFTGEFIPVPPPRTSSEQGVCDMGRLGFKAAYSRARLKKQFGLFWEAASTMKRSPPCTGKGIIGGTWYTLKGLEDGNFAICAGCYASWIHYLGHDSDFIQKPGPYGKAVICNFNLAAPRWNSYLLLLLEATATDDWQKWVDYVIRISGVPPCAKDAVENRRWYGWQDAFICESCFEEVAQGSTLKSHMTYKGVLIEQSILCSLYSDRMRVAWAEACKQQDATSFIEVAKNRLRVFIDVMSEIRMIISAMRNRGMQQTMAFVVSNMLTVWGGVAGAVGIGWTSGNSIVGHDYATIAGVQGAMLCNQAANMKPVQGNEASQVAQLEAAWKSVE